MKKDTLILLIVAVLVVGAGIALVIRARNKAEETNEEEAMPDQQPETVASKIAQTAKDVMNANDPAPAPTGMTQDKWNDPTYVMASRINDSLSIWINANDRTAHWNALAAKSDDFIRHTNNWFNGHFGNGKSMRQKIEETWFGDRHNIINRLSQIGL